MCMCVADSNKLSCILTASKTTLPYLPMGKAVMKSNSVPKISLKRDFYIPVMFVTLG